MSHSCPRCSALAKEPFVVAQAVGMVMARQGASSHDALAHIDTLAETEHVRVATVARGIVSAHASRLEPAT